MADLGSWWSRRKQKRLDEQAALAHQQWQNGIDEIETLIALLQGTTGGSDDALVLKSAERVLATVNGVGLIEDRQGRGTYVGGSSGFSIPVAKTPLGPIRFRVGATRGHYQQGAPVATAVDHGRMAITNQRVVFEGSKKVIECLYAKLVSVQGSDGSVSLAVSNRQKVTTLSYGAAIEEWVHNRIQVALQLFHGTEAAAIASLQGQLGSLQAREPKPPGGPGGIPTAGS